MTTTPTTPDLQDWVSTHPRFRFLWDLELYREDRTAGITRRHALRKMIDLRGRTAYPLHSVGMVVVRLAGRICSDIPSDFTEEWLDGRAYGERRVWRAIVKHADGIPVDQLYATCLALNTLPSKVYAQAEGAMTEARDDVKILWVTELGRDAVWLERLAILLVDASFTVEAAREMIVQAMRDEASA